MKLHLLSILSISLMLTSHQMQSQSFTYLALGDSYTIGEAVLESERWPVQLVNGLKEKGIQIDDPRIIATTGWTTDELQAAITEATISETFDLVSLLIGVNNQYRGYPIGQYERDFEILLKQAIEFAEGKPENVFVVSIPDYGVTPFAKEKGLDADKIARELDNYNKMAAKICQDYKVSFTDITKDSKKAKEDPSLVAKDGLHPSGKMYTGWVNAVFNLVYTNLSSR